MLFSKSILAFAGTLFLVIGVAGAQQQGGKADVQTAALQQQIAELKQQNTALSKSLAQSKTAQAKATKELNKIRLDLEALGAYPLGTDDERLTQAVANRKVLEDRLRKLETASLDLTAKVREYLKHAFNANDEKRVNLESAIRSLDVLLGIIDKPRPQIGQGTLQEAKIVGIDGQLGTLILNAGEKQQVRIGMTFRILRGKSHIADAMIAEVRPGISGALVIKLEDTNNAVRLGDIASIKTNN